MRLAQDKLCAPGGETEKQHPCVLAGSKKRPRVNETPLTVNLGLGGNLQVHRLCCLQPVPPSLPLALQSP